MNRLQAIYRHIGESTEVSEDVLQRLETSSVRTLPRFDSYVLGHYIDDLYDFKQSVYEEFRSRPDLLPPVTEGLTKGVATQLHFGARESRQEVNKYSNAVIKAFRSLTSCLTSTE